MSKAFTKENDLPDDASEGAEEDSELKALPKGTRNYITPAGADRMRGEVKRLLHEERPALVRTVEWAASNGDRSENADYQYGKRRLREIDRRIRFLGKRLDAAEIVDPAKQRSDRVLFGATVTIRDEDGHSRRYRIVGIDESAPGKGDISWTSPVARSLLNARVGDSVNVRTPRGDEELEVVKIEYLAAEPPAGG